MIREPRQYNTLDTHDLPPRTVPHEASDPSASGETGLRFDAQKEGYIDLEGDMILDKLGRPYC